MTVSLLNNKKKTFIVGTVKRLEKLQEKASLKLYTKGLAKDVIDNDILLYVATEKFEIMGYALVDRRLDNKAFIEMLEVFKKNIGIGSKIIDSIKSDFNIIEVDALNNAVGFYLKNGFVIKEKHSFNTTMIFKKQLKKRRIK